MKLLASKQDIEIYLDVSFHRSEEDVNKFIREVQMFDLKPLMCERFYLDLTSNEPSVDYSKMLDGGSYTHNDTTYPFEGLKAVIAYFFYARYMFKSHQKDTPFGIVQKKYHDSEPLSSAERREMNKQYKQQANMLWDDIVKYMNRNHALYPIWNDCYGCDGIKEQSSGFRFKMF